jgi:hypothetical protein
MTRHNIIAARIGIVPVAQAILGLTTVMRTAALYDNFSRSNRFLDDDGRWVSYGPATDHRAVVENTVVRIGIPDNLTTETEAVSYMRCAMGRAFADDGYVQCRVFSVGDTVGLTRYATAVFGRVNEGFTDGVGIHLAGNTLGLVVRRDGDDTVLATFGQFSTNDVIRLVFTGDDYTMYCNSQRRGSWSDRLGVVASGDGHRSLGIRVHGANSGKGSRSFSPALDAVEYG